MELLRVESNGKVIDDVRKYSVVKSDSFLSLLFVLYGIESHWRDDAVSPVGAVGIAQVMPAVGLELAAELGLEITADKLAERPTNILLSSYLLSKLLTNYSNNDILALTAYNGGPARADRLKEFKSIPRETSAYVTKIMYTLRECK